MGGSGPSMVNKFLYAPAPPTPSVWSLKPPLWALVHKTTYAPMIYTALGIIFLGPKWHSPIGSMPFNGPKKLSNSRAQPPSTCPRNGYASIQNIMHGAV